MENQESILIVDDDESTCRTLELIFQRTGYETETAATGSVAIEKACSRFYNLALTDIGLPDIRGTDLLIPLKKFQPDMVVIMITGHATCETAVRALNEGASAYITKPLNMDMVLATIRESLDKQRLVLENRRLNGALRQELAERKRVEEHQERLIAQLREALSKIKTLHGLLPICASCKKIRDDEGYWQDLDAYITDHTEAEFSHGLCPHCAKKLYPGIFKDR